MTGEGLANTAAVPAQDQFINRGRSRAKSVPLWVLEIVLCALARQLNSI